MMWINVGLFVALFLAAMVGEVVWLTKRRGVSGGKAALFTMSTDLTAIGFSGLFLLLISMLTFMMIMGPSGQGGDSPEAAYWAILIAAVVIPPVVFFLLKRMMLAALNMLSGGTAWSYSAISSIVKIVVVLLPSIVFFFTVVI